MDPALAADILREIRCQYRFGYKSSDKIYVLNDLQKKDEFLVAKATKRNKHRLVSEFLLSKKHDDVCHLLGNALEMSIQTAQLVKKHKKAVHIGKICAPGNHTFCIVGYPPGVPSPESIRFMYKRCYKDAWVIDPWMNVSCPFTEYPLRAANKFANWSIQGKHIIFGRKEPKPYDPVDRVYVDIFFKCAPMGVYTLAGDLIHFALPPRARVVHAK